MSRRAYHSDVRARAAEATRRAILEAARAQFEERGIDRVTVADIASAAGVGTSTVYATFASKEGILRALMQDALFGPAYRDAIARLEGEADPVELIRLSASVARAIYQGEDATLGLLRGTAAFAPSLRALEEEFDTLRYTMQEARVVALHAAGRLAPPLSVEDARRILWTLTSREVYRCLVVVAGWAPDRFEAWLAATLVTQLVAPDPQPPRRPHA